MYALYEDAFACIQQSLQQAAAAKQPLLLTSTQHTRYDKALTLLSLEMYAVDT